jgi:AcrR family transcriptional regulator
MGARIIDSVSMAERVSVPRGRHAPPLEVRLEVQRTRLLQAAAEVFARMGYAEASAEAISREAGMSKATFYEHFANKEEAILALFDQATEVVLGRMAQATSSSPDLQERVRSRLHAFVQALAEYPAAAQTLLVEIIGAGPRAMERRDAIMQAFAAAIDEENRRAHERFGAPRLKSIEDAYALVGAISELASRQVRLKRPANVHELEPVIERLILGVLSQSR